MKVGDLIEVNTGHIGLILDTEMLYPGHPKSPVRNYIVMWINEAPRYAVAIAGARGDISKVSSFCVERKINESR